MYKILLATDGSEHTHKVIEEALPIVEGVQASVTVLTVITEHIIENRLAPEVSSEKWNEIKLYQHKEAEKIVEKVALPFREKNLRVETKVVTGKMSEADLICEEAREGNYNLIILGSHGLRGIKEMILGSVSNKVAHKGCKSVLIVK